MKLLRNSSQQTKSNVQLIMSQLTILLYHNACTTFLWSVLFLFSVMFRQVDSNGSSLILSSARKGYPLSHSPQIWLTVSSNPRRLLELNWHRLPNERLQSSWLALYDHEPNQHNFDSSFLDRVHPETTSGKFITSKLYQYFSFQSAINNKSKHYLIDFLSSRNDSSLNKLSSSLWSGCVKYWIALIDYRGQIVLKKCLRTRPRWMEETMSQIGHRSLLELAIPGAHNAASYEVSPNRNFPRLDKYIFCQDESIWNQLIYGTRFFDLRIGYEDGAMDDRDHIWIVHGPLRTNVKLVDVLEQVLAFMLSTRYEIVVLDFHNFKNGFGANVANLNQRHLLVEQMVIDYLGAFLVPVELGFGKPIRDLAAINKRVFVGYKRDTRNARFFHVQAYHVWAQSDQKNELFQYLNERACRSPSANFMVSMMCQMTPRIIGILHDRYQGLRNLAQKVNFDVTISLFEDWWQCCNVVATDYSLGSNVIEFTIEANLKRESKR